MLIIFDDLYILYINEKNENEINVPIATPKIPKWFIKIIESIKFKIASKKKIKFITFISLVAKIVFENTGNIDSLKHIKAAISVKLSPP